MVWFARGSASSPPRLSALRDRARECAVALLWATLVGHPLACHKTTSGPVVVWVGAVLAIRSDGVR
eukprot:7677691-Alexandrium_andersonii.AAC.1